MTHEDMSELAKSLDMSLPELEDIMKAAETEEEPKNEEGDEEEDNDEEGESPEKKLEKSLKADIAAKMKELRNIGKKEDLSKSANDDLIKSFSSMKDDLIKAIGGYKEEVSTLKEKNDDLEKSLGEMKEMLNRIASNSQGVKGMRFTNGNVIEKSIDVEEKDGKKYFDLRDKEGILKSMENIMKSSDDDDLIKSVGDDIIQFNSTSQITNSAVKRLNQNGVFLKEQM
jgi:hypothetical protein